jgi:hypothetical protein
MLERFAAEAGAMRKRIAVVSTVSKEATRRELAAALARYRGTVTRCPAGGSKRRPGIEVVAFLNARTVFAGRSAPLDQAAPP